jgi:HlyD family secretion protein
MGNSPTSQACASAGLRAASVARAQRGSARVRVLLLVLLAGAGAGAWLLLRGRALPVTATPVVRGKAIEAVYATGTVEAENRVVVKAKTSGSIAELLVREGSHVRKGELLASLENAVASFELKRGSADLSAAQALGAKDAPQLAALEAQAGGVRAELRAAQAELDRTQRLYEGGGLPQADLDRARARVEQLLGSLQANQAQQRTLRIDLSAGVARQAAQVQALASRVSDSEVRAPLDGVVLDRHVEPGEVVSVNQPLFLVGDTRSLILEVSVDEADVARISDGTDGKQASQVAISLLAFAERVFEGRGFEILPNADRGKKAFLVKVRIVGPPVGLRSGMTAEVNVITRQREGLLAPASAESDGTLWLARDGVAQLRKVRTGIRDPLRVELLEGVAEGELVIVEGQGALKPGSALRVTTMAADKFAPAPGAADAAQTSL